MMKLGQVTRATSKHRGLNHNQIVLQISSTQNDKISDEMLVLLPHMSIPKLRERNTQNINWTQGKSSCKAKNELI